jgi:threonine dehydrogenase-like Zn-dependent dehydrogenase
MKVVVFRASSGLVSEEIPDYKVAAGEVLVKVADTGFCGPDHSLIAGGFAEYVKVFPES